MLVIEVKDADSLDRALKKYKKKVDRTGLIKELRRRQQYVKPSVQRRNELLKASYRNEVYSKNQ